MALLLVASMELALDVGGHAVGLLHVEVERAREEVRSAREVAEREEARIGAVVP